MIPHTQQPQKHFPKRHAPGSLVFMNVVFYRGERYFIEQAPSTWQGSGFVRLTDRPLRKERETWPNERQSFAVYADLLNTAPPVANVFTATRLPTPASAERAERTKAGVRDVGDEVAVLLRGCKDLDAVYKVAAKYLGVPEQDLRDKYAHLNPGQQRMNCGNKMRFKMRKGA